MPTVSVITAAWRASDAFLLDAYHSLVAQDVDWEWIIETDDDPQPHVPADLNDDPRVQVRGHERSLGAAVSRNLALGSARGTYIQNLDADDALLPGALEVGVAALREHEHAAFVFGRSLAWLPDNTRQTLPWCNAHYAPGLIPAGEVERRWREEGNHAVPIHALLWRRTPLLAVGGWGGLRFSEDALLMHAAAATWPVVHVDADTYLYRQHDEQITRDAANLALWQRGWDVIHQRLLALRELRGEAVPVGWEQAPRVPSAAAQEV